MKTICAIFLSDGIPFINICKILSLTLPSQFETQCIRLIRDIHNGYELLFNIKIV